MKKIFLYVVMCVTTLGFMASCGDNEDVSAPHVLTDDEIAEIARQEEEESIARTKWDVAKMWEYETSFFISANAYDGALVEIDTVEIAEYLGLTPEQLRKGIYNMRSGEWGAYDDDTTAPKLTGFCINASTRQDEMTAYNTNGCWGHWWDENGDVTSWGDNARVFAEYDVAAGAFNVGQMPGLLVAGQDYTFVECIKYQDTRIGVMITVHAEARGEVKAEIVNTQQLSIDMTPATGYGTTPLAFDLEKTLSDLGVASMEEVKFVAPKEDGSYAQEYTTANGFWYDANGFECAWGENARGYTTYGEEHLAENEIGVGQFPGQTAEGDVYVLKYGIMAGNKIEMLEVTINIIGYQDPETAPEGEPTTVEKDITITKGYDNTYSAVNFDLKDLMKDAFKMTTYQIFKAIQDGELKLYEGEVTEEDPSYTANAPGYWLDGEGHAAAYADGVFYVETGRNETTLTLNVGNHPDNCSPNGQTANTKLIYTCNGGQLVLNVTLEVTAFQDPETAPEGDPYDLEVPVEMSLVYSEAGTTWGGDTEAGEKVKDALKMTTYQFSQALESGDIQLYINEVTDPAPTQCWAGEFFVDGEGTVVSEEAAASYIVGFYPDGTDLYVEVGNIPANTAVGDVLNIKLIAVAKGVTVTLPITVEITE